jgi:uncharacterized protein (DUF2267 family)
MSTIGLEVFDSTLQKTAAWLNDVSAELSLHDRHQAYQALRAVLHALRDRLTVEEVTQLGAQLPMLVRGFYYEGWTLSGKPVKWHKAEFLAHITKDFPLADEIDPERVVSGVFSVLARRVSAGEIDDVKHVLPKELRALWPEARQGGSGRSRL